MLMSVLMMDDKKFTLDLDYKFQILGHVIYWNFDGCNT